LMITLGTILAAVIAIVCLANGGWRVIL
jgi:hypothetical protein